MGIKAVVVLLVGLALVSVHLAEAQQPGKIAKIAWLGARSASASGRELLNRELHVLGYVEGKNVAFEYRYADNKLDQVPALAEELVRLKVDVLVTPGSIEALAPRTLPGRSPSFF
jgi:putative ABC transport system substrate-binding protein